MSQLGTMDSRLADVDARLTARLQSVGLGPPPPPTLPAEPGGFESFLSGFQRGGYYNPRIAFNELTFDHEEAVQLAKEAEELFPVARSGVASFAGSVGSGFGSAIPTVAALAAAPFTGGSSIPVGFAAGFGAGVAGGMTLHELSNYEDATGFDLGGKKQLAAIGSAALTGLSEYFGTKALGGLTNPAINTAVGKAILARQQGGQVFMAPLMKAIGVSAGIGALTEGTEEALEQFGNNWIDSMVTGGKSGLTGSIAESFAVGAITGAPIGGVSGGMSAALGQMPPVPPAPAPAMPPAMSPAPAPTPVSPAPPPYIPPTVPSPLPDTFKPTPLVTPTGAPPIAVPLRERFAPPTPSQSPLGAPPIGVPIYDANNAVVGFRLLPDAPPIGMPLYDPPPAYEITPPVDDDPGINEPPLSMLGGEQRERLPGLLDVPPVATPLSVDTVSEADTIRLLDETPRTEPVSAPTKPAGRVETNLLGQPTPLTGKQQEFPGVRQTDKPAPAPTGPSENKKLARFRNRDEPTLPLDDTTPPPVSPTAQKPAPTPAEPAPAQQAAPQSREEAARPPSAATPTTPATPAATPTTPPAPAPAEPKAGKARKRVVTPPVESAATPPATPQPAAPAAKPERLPKAANMKDATAKRAKAETQADAGTKKKTNPLVLRNKRMKADLDTIESNDLPNEADSVENAGAATDFNDDSWTAFEGPIPTELKTALEGQGGLLRLLRANKRGGRGEEYLGDLRDVAIKRGRGDEVDMYIARLRGGDLESGRDKAKRILSHAEGVDDKNAVLAAWRVNDNKYAKGKNAPLVNVSELPPGSSFSIGGEPFTVGHDGMLEDGDSFPPVPALFVDKPIHVDADSLTVGKPVKPDTQPTLAVARGVVQEVVPDRSKTVTPEDLEALGEMISKHGLRNVRDAVRVLRAEDANQPVEALGIPEDRFAKVADLRLELPLVFRAKASRRSKTITDSTLPHQSGDNPNVPGGECPLVPF